MLLWLYVLKFLIESYYYYLLVFWILPRFHIYYYLIFGLYLLAMCRRKIKVNGERFRLDYTFSVDRVRLI